MNMTTAVPKKQALASLEDFSAIAPVLYTDLSMDAVVCHVDKAIAQKFLPSKNYVPLTYMPGQVLAALLCFEYRATGIEPYNEVALVLPLAKYGQTFFPGVLSALSELSTNTMNAHVIELPVNTEFSLRGGVEVFGYPKFLADIQFLNEGRRRTCEIRDNEERFLLLRMGLDAHSGFAFGKTRFVFHTYPIRHGHTLKTTFKMEFDDLRINPFPKKFSLELGGGAMAEACNLLLRHPLLTLSVKKGKGALELPEVLHG